MSKGIGGHKSPKKRPSLPRGMHSLVNAQVDVNRAVFEANKPVRVKPEHPRLEYLRRCVEDAIKSLTEFLNTKQ